VLNLRANRRIAAGIPAGGERGTHLVPGRTGLRRRANSFLREPDS
jgi:hypothetical protein